MSSQPPAQPEPGAPRPEAAQPKARPRGRRLVTLATEIGSRSEQQDAGQFWQKGSEATLVVVCDGVGGSRSGGEASAIVVRTAEELWKSREGTFADPQQDLLSLARVAHQRIVDLAGAGEKRAPASTLTALYVTPGEAHWIHSGDSRVYHFREGQLVTRTKDHSVVQILVDQGEVAEADMGTHPDQGRLLQSLGTREYREPGYRTAAIGDKDAFILCTDGFWERTPPQEMRALLATAPGQLPSALQEAVARAVAANGPEGDNVTAAVVAPLSLAGNLLVFPRDVATRVALAAALILSLAAIVYFSTRSAPQPPPPFLDPASPAPVSPQPSPTVKPSPAASPTVEPHVEAATPKADAPVATPLKTIVALQDPNPSGVDLTAIASPPPPVQEAFAEDLKIRFTEQSGGIFISDLITSNQWKQVMGPREGPPARSANDRPITNVSYKDAREFTKALTNRLLDKYKKVYTGWAYRPLKAEELLKLGKEHARDEGPELVWDDKSGNARSMDPAHPTTTASTLSLESESGAETQFRIVLHPLKAPATPGNNAPAPHR